MEIAAFLALHPGAGRDELTEVIWPTKHITAGHRQNQMWVLRTWLGSVPDGEPYVGNQAGAGAYTLHPDVRLGWTEFAALAKWPSTVAVSSHANRCGRGTLTERPRSFRSAAWADPIAGGWAQHTRLFGPTPPRQVGAWS